MRLSVVLPNFNHARFLPEALESLLTQSLPPDEILVVDDASTDGSVDLISGWSLRDPRVRLLRNDTNQGPAVGMNRGLALANGDWVLFSAADDRVLPDLFARSLRLLASHPEAGLCTSLSRVIDDQGRDLGVYASPRVLAQEGFLSSLRCLRALQVCGPWFMGNTAIYRREALQAAGGFHPELRSLCDGFACQLLALRHGACFIPEPLACWRKTVDGYAASDNADWQGRFRLRERAAELMRASHADVFPEAYVSHWERQSRYAAARMAWRGIRGRRDAYRGETLLRLRQPERAWERLLLGCAEGLARSEDLLVRLHLFLCFRGVGPWIRGKVGGWRDRG